MKKFILRFTFIAIAMVAFTAVSNASTTIYFKMKITDNGTFSCPVPYTDFYCARIFIILNGEALCVHEQCNITAGNEIDVTWVCNQDLAIHDCDYQIRYDICRFTFPSTRYCWTSHTTFDVCWSELSDGHLDFFTIN